MPPPLHRDAQQFWCDFILLKLKVIFCHNILPSCPSKPAYSIFVKHKRYFEKIKKFFFFFSKESQWDPISFGPPNPSKSFVFMEGEQMMTEFAIFGELSL